MGVVRFTDGRSVQLPHDKALDLWNVWNGRAEPTDKQSRFCEQVQRIYLNWRTAPADYLLEREPILLNMYHDTPSMSELNKRLASAKNGELDAR